LSRGCRSCRCGPWAGPPSRRPCAPARCPPSRPRCWQPSGGGRLGWALDTAAHPERLADRTDLLDTLAALPAADLPTRFAWAADLAGRFSAHRAEVFETLTQLAVWWRDLLVVRVGAPDLVYNTDHLAALHTTAAGFTPAQIGHFLAAIPAAQEHLEGNVSPRLVLESLILAMPGA
jgi:hypothetical protein